MVDLIVLGVDSKKSTLPASNRGYTSVVSHSPAMAFNEQTGASVLVWTGAFDRHLYLRVLRSGFLPDSVQRLPEITTSSAPLVTAVDGGFIIFLQGPNGSIYYTHNIGRPVSPAFSEWRLIALPDHRSLRVTG